jgi:Zn-dependent peptidase ImmA (M78 family)
VSGAFADARIEKFCNEVAAGFLLPTSELPGVGVDRDTDQATAARVIGEFAEERHLSRSMVAYSLLRAGSLTEETWRALSSLFEAQWRRSRDARRERKSEGSGPSYYVVRRHRLGLALLRFVSRNIGDGVLTPTKASKVLGVNPRSVAPLLSTAALSGGKAA